MHNISKNSDINPLNYLINIEKEIIIDKFNFVYNKNNNFININELQKLITQDLVTIVQNNFLSQIFTFNTKGDIIKLIIYICNLARINIRGCGLCEIIIEKLDKSNDDTRRKLWFVRHNSNAYKHSNDDIFISNIVALKHGLRYGDEIIYEINELCSLTVDNYNNKLFKIDNVISINGIELQQNTPLKRTWFAELTPYHPERKVNLAKGAYKNNILLKILDIFCPIGYGQRMLVVSPPKSGKTTVYENIANTVGTNDDTKVILLMIDERPEEVTDLNISIKNIYKSFYSDFNEKPINHVNITELCIEHAKRLCEIGKHVFIFVDSLTRISRAYNCIGENSNKVMSGGIEQIALQKSKKIFGVARNTKSGSISIIATCLYNTGSKMDDVIFEEFKGTSNSDLCLDRLLAEKGIFPAIDIEKSSTRKSELLLNKDDLNNMYFIRKILNKYKGGNATSLIINNMINSLNTVEFFNSFR